MIHSSLTDPVESTMTDSLNPASRKISNPSLDASPDEWSSMTRDLVDGLPRVWTRGLLYFLLVFLATVIPWAALSKVDETGTARGRLEPDSRAIQLDASIAGTITSIPVEEGQMVQAGQILVELDTALLRADLQEAQARLEGLQNRATQLELMRNQLEIANQSQLSQNQAQQSAQLAQINQARQRLRASQSNADLASDRLRRDRIEVDRYQYLLGAGAVPEAEVAEILRTVDESQQRLQRAESDRQQAEYEIAEQQSNYDHVVRTGELTLLENQQRIQDIDSQISDVWAEIEQTQQQIQSLQVQLRQHVLRAPTDGTIFHLSVQTPGKVLQPGQQVAQIAPDASDLIFRAHMPSSESGFLQIGMPVKLKFDAYPFQDYGVVSGQLRWISPDSRQIEVDEGRIEAFSVEITLNQTYIESSTGPEMLKPGQTASAEVVVRQRRVIDYILDPFNQLRRGGVNF
jgi:hemolysin D